MFRMRQEPVEEASIMERSAGDSLEQREAEGLIISLLSERLGLSLEKRRFAMPAGGWLEMDGACDSPRVLCEAWSHQGKPKSAQKNKVMADAIKLLYASRLAPEEARLILALGDEEAAIHFKGKSWMAQALRAHGIEVQVIDLPAGTRGAIRKAQHRQYR